MTPTPLIYDTLPTVPVDGTEDMDPHGNVYGVDHRQVEPGDLLRHQPCPECKNQFGGKMPGHKYGSNWDWVPCQTCHGSGLVQGTIAEIEELMRAHDHTDAGFAVWPVDDWTPDTQGET